MSYEFEREIWTGPAGADRLGGEGWERVGTERVAIAAESEDLAASVSDWVPSCLSTPGRQMVLIVRRVEALPEFF